MKLTNISIQNMLGIRDLAIDLKTPLTLFAGPNGAGKSSIQNAVRMALTGAPSRVSKKGEYSQLIHAGAKKASVSVNADGQAYGLDLPKGAAVHNDNPFLPYVLEPSQFAALSAQERRKALFELFGVQASTEIVRKRLERRQCDLKLAEQLIPLLRSGFPAACEAAKERAKLAKGAWGQITGETWGASKGESWTPSAAAQDISELPDLRQKLAILDAQIEAAQVEVGSLLATEQQRTAAIQRRQELHDKCADINTRLLALESAQRHVKEQEAQLERLQAAATALVKPHDPLACPHCGGAVVLQDGVLSEYQPPSVFDAQPDPQAAQTIAKHKDALEMLRRAEANRQREYDAAKTAHDQAAAIEIPDVDQGAAQKARGAIDAKKQARADLVEEIKALSEAEASNKAAHESAEKAATKHAEIMAWLVLAAAFDADGIPGELLSEALSPINERLRLGAVDTGWKQIRITEEIDIEADGRPYHLLSESEKWRTDAMLAECISHFSGLKLLCLDRIDVLDIPSRGVLLEWLDWLTNDGDQETVLLFGTLKSCPTSNAVMTAHWIEGGTIQSKKQEKAA